MALSVMAITFWQKGVFGFCVFRIELHFSRQGSHTYEGTQKPDEPNYISSKSFLKLTKFNLKRGKCQ
jgi:hypothetical protein